MIFFKNPNSNFTLMDNRIMQDSSISLQARAIYCLIRSFGINWKINRKHLAKVAGLGLSTLSKYLNELVEINLLKMVQLKDERGRFTNEVEYIFADVLKDITELEIDIDYLDKGQVKNIYDSLENRFKGDNCDVETDNTIFTCPNFKGHINIISNNNTEIDSAPPKNQSNPKSQYALIDLLKLHKDCIKAVTAMQEKQKARDKSEKDNYQAFLESLSEEEANKYFEFMSYRQEANNGRALKPTTKRAIQNNLLRLKMQNQDIVEIMQRSINQGWLGLFALTPKPNANKGLKKPLNAKEKAKERAKEKKYISLVERYGDMLKNDFM